jgi:hypothetical protein
MSPDITEIKIGNGSICVENNSIKGFVVKKVERDLLFRGWKYGLLAIWVLSFFLYLFLLMFRDC